MALGEAPQIVEHRLVVDHAGMDEARTPREEAGVA